MDTVSEEKLVALSSVDVFTTDRSDKQGYALLKAAPFNVDQSGNITWLSPELAANILRCPQSDLPKNRAEWIERLHAEDKRACGRLFKDLKWDGARYAMRYRVRTSDDRWIWLEENAERLEGEEDRPHLVQAVIQDIHQSQSEQERAAWLSRHDNVTGLPNKVNFIEKLEILNALARRTSNEGAVFKLKLSNLDNIHLIYGFEAGERVLRAIANRLNDIVKVPDCLATEGLGDFLLGVLGISGQDSDPIILAKRLKMALSDRPYLTPQGRIKAEIVISHTVFPQKDRAVETLLAQTDRAMEVDPTQSLSQYAPIMGLPATSQRPHQIGKDEIIAALNEQRISLAYQPIIHARTGELHHYECLLRLRQEDGALVSAWQLILAAEKLGFVHFLDRRALDTAAVKLKEQPNLKLALNVSAETVKDAETAEAYIEALKALGPLTQRITLELTETAALNDPALAAQFSNETRALGCEFAIDDFGSGYTSFQNLLAIEAETIKIDGSLINGISTSPHMQSFVRMMVDLAQTFSVKTVAEMVEDKADAALLRRLGVDYLQGYLFGMPSPTPSFTKED